MCRYVNTRLGRWAVTEHGQAGDLRAPCVVLLHALTVDASMWAAQVPALGELGARVLVIEGPGHGKSQPTARFTLEEQADALTEALSALGVERALLAGLSWGGMVAMRYALAHPTRTSALALLSTSAGVESKAQRRRFHWLLRVHRWFGTPRWLYEREVVPLLYSRAARQQDRSLVDRAFQSFSAPDRGGMAEAARAVVDRQPILERLSQLPVPTLVLVGARDRLTPPAASHAISRALPNAHLEELPGVGHLSALEAPEPVNRVLVPFVAQHLWS